MTGSGSPPGAPPATTWRAVGERARAAVGEGDGWRVLEEASGLDRAQLVRHLDAPAPSRAVAYAEAMVERRAAGEPLQYVLGRWSFRRLDLLVDRRVLIPRPETEVVAGVAIGELRRLAGDRPLVAVDLGTGSGAIALALADEVPRARVWATDVSAGALAVAAANLAGTGSLVGPRVRLVLGDWFDALPEELRGRVGVVVSNPPYVADGEVLPAEVADWEPTGALYAGPSGLEGIEAVVTGAPGWLARPGSVVVEVAPHQAEQAVRLATTAGFDHAEVVDDLAGRARVLVGRFTG